MKNIFPGQIVSLDFFLKERPKLDKVVLVGGAFDILHEGHIRHLQKAKSLGNILIVHITSDERIREKKGSSRPVFSQAKRALVVASLRFVDYVFIYHGRHYDREVIDKIQPDILFFNEEAFSNEVKIRIKSLRSFNGKIIVSRQKKLDSTSRAFEALKQK